MTPKNADCPKKTRILIVDDESNLTDLYQKILENEYVRYQKMLLCRSSHY